MIESWLRLRHTPGLGTASFAHLLRQYGRPEDFLGAGPRAWRALGLDDRAVSFLEQESPAGVQRDLDWAQAPGHHLITLSDPRYPERLREISAPPPVLYVVGDPQVLRWPSLAIVGSRRPTPGGQENARDFAGELARAGLVIASGLALGIDGSAHSASLDVGGLGIAVTGSGPDRIYPAAHRDLARRLVAEGALVTELPVGTPPLRENFPLRNRILAGLCLGVLVVEAAARSGSLITARLAAEHGREVFAIPGSIHNPMSRGCHSLIRQGARLVETPGEILEELARYELRPPIDPPAAGSPARAVDTLPGPDDAEHERLLGALGHDPVSVDQLVSRTGLTVAVVSSMLLIMELRGQVASLSAGTYCRLKPESRG